MVSSTHEHHDYVRKAKFPYPVDRQAVEADWRPRGFSLVEMTQPPGAMLRRTTEKKDELVVVAQGCLECYLGSESSSQEAAVVLLQQGDELFIPCFTPFEARVPDIAGKTVLFYIGFE